MVPITDDLLPITLPSHGRGHKFETCTAHQKYLAIGRIFWFFTIKSSRIQVWMNNRRLITYAGNVVQQPKP